MEWQAIETAPKDGTRILTWRAANKGTLGNINVTCWDKTSFGYHWRALPMTLRINPTHWMPLPPPPVNVENKPIDKEKTK